jgi:hypothetical protein
LNDEDAVSEQRQRYRELLEELRTVIPGVQVLFGFLLTVPFTSRFPDLDQLGTLMFVVSLVAVALSAVILVTPAAYHRLTPRHARRQRIRLGVRVTIVGMSFLGLSIGSSVFVVARFIFATDRAAAPDVLSPTTIGAAIAGVVSATTLVLWFLVPFLRRDVVEDDGG